MATSFRKFICWICWMAIIVCTAIAEIYCYQVQAYFDLILFKATLVICIAMALFGLEIYNPEWEEFFTGVKAIWKLIKLLYTVELVVGAILLIIK